MEFSDLVSILAATITAAAGVIGTLFGMSLKNKHQKERDEIQQRADERDAHNKALDEALERADTLGHYKKLWKNEYYYLRAWILQQGVLTSEQLQDMPRPPEHR